MRNHSMSFMVVLLTVLVLPPVAAAQTSPSFDPHDLNGIWNWASPDRGFSLDVPPMTPEGEARFNANKPGYGTPLGSPPRPGAPVEHIGRRRAVPPAQGNDPVGECNPLGMPRVLFTLGPFEFIQTKDRILQFIEWHRVLREIWTDGRKLPEPDRPRWYGYSVGRWEGDTFVVDSHGYDDRTWLDHFGYPHSDEMRLQERYRRFASDTLELTVTLNDPKTYTKPWISEKKVYKLRPGTEISEEICAPIDEVDNFNKRVRDPAGGVGGTKR